MDHNFKHLVFDEPKVLVKFITKSYIVEVFDLFNNVGGCLGMFLGMSLFSILVTIQKAIDKCCTKRRPNEGSNGTNAVRPVEIDLQNMLPKHGISDAPPALRF